MDGVVVGDIIMLLERWSALNGLGLVSDVVATSDGESTPAPDDNLVVLTTGLGSTIELLVAAGDMSIAEDVSSCDVILDPIEDGFDGDDGEFNDDGDMICGSSNSLDVLGESKSKLLSIFVVVRLIDSWKLLFECDAHVSVA